MTLTSYQGPPVPKSGRISEDQLHQLGFAVVGDQAVPVTDAAPDDTWDLDRLAGYAAGQIVESVLCAHKSAVALFRAGGALALARERCKTQGHGAWAAWKRKHGLKDTTVNDAIRLHENAGTEAALAGLGITEAKERFVYRAKKVTGDPKGRNRVGPAGRAVGAAPPDHPPAGGVKAAPAGDDKDDSGASGTPEEGAVTDDPDSDDSLAGVLERLAQRVNEIAQDESGTVDWSVEDFERVENAVIALDRAAADLLRWLNGEKGNV